MKRAISISVLLSVACAGVLSSSLVASAATAKTVIEDPAGDANFINDQGTGDGSVGDQNPADAGNVSDLISVALANDAENLYVTFYAEGAPPATQGLGYRVRFNPDGAAGSQCILIEAFFPGATNVMTEFKAHVVDTCAGGDPVPVEILGTMLTIPRSANEAFGKGKTLAAPQAQSFVWWGSYPEGAALGTMDTTKVGTDYRFVDKKRK